jgi:inorganic pyrophosphatase
MGSDLFGSFAEATSAALVIASNSPTFYYHPNALYYPLFISAFGILVCLVTSVAAFGGRVETFRAVSEKLKN